MEATGLVKFDAARAAITKAVAVDEVKSIRDKAEAARQYAKQAGYGLDMQNQCAEIKIRAERRAGQILRDMEKNKGGQPKKNPSHDGSASQTLAEMGITTNQSSRWQLEAEVPDDEFETHLKDTTEAGKELTSAAIQKVARQERTKKKTEEQQEERAKSVKTIGVTITKADALTWIPQQPLCDLLLTDPPYMYDGKGNVLVDDIYGFAESWLNLALSRLKNTGRGYVFVGAYPDELAAYIAVAKPEQILVWTYRNTLGPSPKYDYKQNWQAILYYRGDKADPLDCPKMTEQFSVQDINAPDGRLGDRYHAWQKPDAIADRFIQHSTKEGDVVLDPFAGTGTFVIAAAKLKRTIHACENNSNMLKIAKSRGCNVS